MIAADAPIDRLLVSHDDVWQQLRQAAPDHWFFQKSKTGGEELGGPSSLGDGDGYDSGLRPPAKIIRFGTTPRQSALCRDGAPSLQVERKPI